MKVRNHVKVARQRRMLRRSYARQNEVTFSWQFVGHVDPPMEHKTGEATALFYYLGPNHYPAGLYLPKGYNIEMRDGDDPGWKVIRARCCLTEQVLTMWVLPPNEQDSASLTPQIHDGEQ